MRNIAKYLGIVMLGATSLLTACQDDIDAPGVKVPTASLTPNTTINELKTRYWSDDANYIKTIEDDIVIAGRVISSDRAGNIYKNLVIQDATGALALSINANSLYNNYREGQEIVINAKDMHIGKYSGLQQLGFPDYSEGFGWQATFMPLEFFESHAELNGLPEPSKIDTITVNKFSDISSSPEGLRQWQSQLVRFNNCHFAQGGQANFTDGHKVTSNRDLILEDGSTINVRTSGYSNFWSNVLPEGNGDVVGILSYFNNSWQLLLRSYSDCMNFGHPTLQPGSEDNPWDVDRVVEMEANGVEQSGWVTGYIVGAVAPAVSSVSGDNDIEWGASVTMPNTLVIAPTPEVKSIANCLVLPLPQGSALRNYGALSAHPELYKRQIWVNGTFSKQLGTWGVATRSGSASEFRIEGVTVDDKPDEPSGEGNGTQASPYTVDQVLKLNNPGTSSYVTGYIVGWVEGAAMNTGAHFTVPASSASNVLLAAKAGETDVNKCIPVQLYAGTDVRKAVNLMDNPGNLGKQLTVKGSLERYFGTTGVKNPITDYELDGNGGGEVTPPTPPAGQATFRKVSAITSGKQYVFVIDGQVGTAISATASYGRLGMSAVTIANDQLTTSAENAITVTAVSGGYTLVDANGRYLGMDSSHLSSFQFVSATDKGAVWTATFEGGLLKMCSALNPNCAIVKSGTFTNIAPSDIVKFTTFTLPALYERVN